MTYAKILIGYLIFNEAVSGNNDRIFNEAVPLHSVKWGLLLLIYTYFAFVVSICGFAAATKLLFSYNVGFMLFLVSSRLCSLLILLKHLP